MSKKEADDAAIALRKEKDSARMAAYLEANTEKVGVSDDDLSITIKTLAKL
jgi:hypothetical protein